MVTPGYGVNLPSLSTQLIQNSVVRLKRFEFEFEIGVNKNDQRDAVGFWGQKKSGFNKQSIKFLVGLIILMMLKLVLVLVAAIFEAAQHSVLKALIIVICPFFQIQQKSTQNSCGACWLGGSLQSAYFSPASLITSMP